MYKTPCVINTLHFRLFDVLLLWHHTQIYHNIVNEKSEHTQQYCLDAALEFFPDVATSLTYRQMDILKHYDATSSQFDALKIKLSQSLQKQLKNVTFQEKLQAKLENITVLKPRSVLYQYDYYNTLDLNVTDYRKNLKTLIKSYRQRLFSFVGKSVDDIEYV